MEYVIGAVLGLILGGAVGIFAERAIRGTAFKTRDEIIEQAKRDSENLVKTAELTAKEEGLRRREAADKELNAARDELRNQERQLDKRGSGLKCSRTTSPRRSGCWRRLSRSWSIATRSSM